MHSDFPWRPGTGGSIVCDDPSLGSADAESLEFYGGRLVCETIEPRNRDFVIRACHCHANLLKACENLEQLSKRQSESHLEFFERIAEMFHRDTGMLHPAKDQAVAAGGEPTPADRKATYSDWVESFYNHARDAIETARC